VNLVEAIGRLKLELTRVTHMLYAAQGQREMLARKIAVVDVESLRKDLALYCHPDRGGDVSVMQRINVLCDALLEI
jgi:hypothetical protein